jgi:excisionase family DNA binding protein
MKSEPQIPGREGRFAYSINEVCATTNLGRDAVYRAISAGQLVARKLGRRSLPMTTSASFLLGCRAPAHGLGDERGNRPEQ